MWDRVRGMLALDLAKIDLRKGVVGLIAIVVAIIFIAVFGTAGMAAGIAALFVIVADTPGAPSRERLVSVLVLGIVGALVTLVAVWAGVEHAWISSLLTFGVVFAGTVAAGFGRGDAVRGLLLSLWAVIALSLAGVGVSAVELAGAYLLGGAVAAVVLVVQSRVSPAPPIEPEAGRAPVAFGDLLRSRIGGFALLRAASVGLATALGIELYPEHPIWPAITVLLVLRPKPGEALSIGVLRTLGTFAGVVVATALVHVSGGSDVAVALAFLRLRLPDDRAPEGQLRRVRALPDGGPGPLAGSPRRGRRCRGRAAPRGHGAGCAHLVRRARRRAVDGAWPGWHRRHTRVSRLGTIYPRRPLT